ncbi:hypothetical protein SAMN05216419_10652 [Nitrosomonas cryotolerans]|uniref:Uncharacterized protein n=1 Tax=Nitrosomonas cryotolerans ATCC 49181 TaxID=1131553 RepID=A0A1N6JY07_9PROT|nr:hypothetical protein [Nitrosomonas cryotolerans]SFQ11289.1 hypothetical protein SAMN05216419_10652 [Nitrosomonas cryotolerans]SIO49143.1 hypothetical protein SAMN02743940_0018 [Nitrosomonas cryotolerans ATCC 49181]
MHPQIELQFYWRHQDIKEAITAVAKAIAAGYDTKVKLLAALPQFSTFRIALAIDALITADMAENNLGTLSIHPDMDIVFELLKGKFVLPLSLKDAKAPAIRRVLLNKLGCKNPAGVETLLNISTPGV